MMKRSDSLGYIGMAMRINSSAKPVSTSARADWPSRGAGRAAGSMPSMGMVSSPPPPAAHTGPAEVPPGGALVATTGLHVLPTTTPTAPAVPNDLGLHGRLPQTAWLSAARVAYARHPGRAEPVYSSTALLPSATTT